MNVFKLGEPLGFRPFTLLYWQAIAGAAGALGNIASTLFGNSSNGNLNKKNRRWQTAERLASQEYQTGEREAQNNWSEDMYNQYSSPQAMVAQYRAAGLNPGLAADGGSVGSPTSGSGSTGGAPSGQTPATIPMQAPDLSGGFVNIANALKSIADAKKSGVETDYLEKSAVRQLKNLDLQNAALELSNQITSAKAAKELEKLCVEIESGRANIDVIKQTFENLKKEGSLKDMELDTFMARFEKFLEHEDADIANTNADTAKKKAETAWTEEDTKRITKQIDLFGAEIAESYAHARDLNESSEDKRQFREHIISEIKSRVSNNDADTALAILKQVNQQIRNSRLSANGTEEYGNDWVSSLARTLLDQVDGITPEWAKNFSNWLYNTLTFNYK